MQIFLSAFIAWLVLNLGVAMIVSKTSKFRELGVTPATVPVILVMWSDEKLRIGYVPFISSFVALIQFVVIMVLFFPLFVWGFISKSSS